uniref:HNH endonuclease n=1 Tax=viral metagenome TaxID=1070528 RepID=A0A6M3JYH1_9ZZZZ
MIPKQPRETDKVYLDFVRTKKCVCGDSKTTPHHTISRGAWGSDYRTIPLCLKCHITIHQKGMKDFEKKYNFDHLDAIIKLLSEYVQSLNTEGGEGAA